MIKRYFQCFKIVIPSSCSKWASPKISNFFWNFQILLWFCHEHHGNQNQESTVYIQKKKYLWDLAHHEWQNTLKIHWYSTGPTIYNWNTMFQYWDTMALGSGLTHSAAQRRGVFDSGKSFFTNKVALTNWLLLVVHTTKGNLFVVDPYAQTPYCITGCL